LTHCQSRQHRRDRQPDQGELRVEDTQRDDKSSDRSTESCDDNGGDRSGRSTEDNPGHG
jgi:hypothetical protein